MTARHHPSQPPPADAGYTVLELLVVLAVLGLALAIALPRLGPATAAGELRAAASELAAAARTARAEALHGGAERALVVDTEHRTWRLGRAGTARQLPPRLTFSVASPSAVSVSAREHRFRFFPDGGSSGGVLAITDGARAARIEIDWLTGGVRVVVGR